MKKVIALIIALLFLLPIAALAEGEPASTAEPMPYWYPEDVSAWTFTPAGASAPRVVDDAGIFTDEEEAKLEAHIREAVAGLDMDIVIFTDTSTHGLSVPVYAADFYDFNGYGYGDTHDGFCLFLDMDPYDRQGWCCVTGRFQDLYTESIANDIDDVLYEYLGDGYYFEGVYDWINNIATFAEKGIPFAPEWYPSVNESFVRTHDHDAPRVTDAADVLEDGELEDLTNKVKELSDKLGVDVVLHFSNTSCGMSRQDYCDAFYKYNGYGFGDNYDGVSITVFTGSGSTLIYLYGSAEGLVSDKNVDQIEKDVERLSTADSFYKAGKRAVSYLDTTIRTGVSPRPFGVWLWRVILGSIVGLIVSSILVSSAKATMKTVRKAYDANEHLVEGSLTVGNKLDEFTHQTVTRTYSPRSSGSGRSGGGGGSSHSSSYHGSSGSSHSGSGRHF